ncbi:MAG: 5-formyltetrahydrofolate cyclo-ligase [bacterium]
MMDKTEWRRQALIRRDALPEFERRQAAADIIRRLRALPEYRGAHTIAVYHPMRSEVDLMELLDDREKLFCFPKITDSAHALMEFRVAGAFVPGIFRTKEPVGPIVAAEQIDLILVPGVVFDRRGYRLGYGKGYYDRYLSVSPIHAIGVCFHFQLAEELPAEPHDVRMDQIITDREELCIRH